MSKIGIVSHEGVLDTAPLGSKKILMVQCKFSDGGTETVVYPQSLEDAPPQEGWILYCERFSGGLIALSAWDGKESEAKPGERVLYALDPTGNPSSKISLLNSGQINIESITKLPVKINDGLFSTALSPYFTAENSANTTLAGLASAAAAQAGVLDGLSGGTGAFAAFVAGVAAFCSAMIAADTAASTATAKVVT